MQIEFTTRGLLSNFFRQRRKLIVVFLLTLLIGFGYMLITKPTYEASGSLLIKFGHDAPSQISHIQGNGDTTVISQDDRREMMQSNVDILQSHNLIYALVKEIDPENLYPGITTKAGGADFALEAAVRKLLKSDLTIKSSQMSNVIDVQVQNQNPQMAAWVAYRLMQSFIARQAEIYNKPQTDFLRDQAKDAKAKLEESQKELQAYKEEKGISSIDEEMSELLRQKSDAGTIALESNDSAWDKLSAAQSEEAHLSAIYLPDSVQVARAHEKTMLAKQQLQSRQGELRSRTEGASMKINRRIAQLEGERSHYNDLMRQVEIDEKNYKNFQLNSEGARVSDTLNQKNITSVVVIDQPVVPAKPAFPRKPIVLSITVLAALVLSLGLALMVEAFDQRFTTPEQVMRNLGIPVLASFSRTRGNA